MEETRWNWTESKITYFKQDPVPFTIELVETKLNGESINPHERSTIYRYHTGVWKFCFMLKCAASHCYPLHTFKIG